MGDEVSAIKKVKDKGAAGLDNIPASFLKWLGPLVLDSKPVFVKVGTARIRSLE